MEDKLLHYGIKRRSGRYPWGSGATPYQREQFSFISDIDKMRSSGKTDKEIAESLGISTTDLRSKISLANQEIKKANQTFIADMHEKGVSNVDIAKELGMSEASVRNYLKRNTNEGNTQTAIDNTVDALKRGVEQTGYLDVGVGVERQIGVSREKLRAATKQLLEEGYYEHNIYVRQINDPSKWTTIKVLTKEPDLKEANKHKYDIRSLEEWSDDGGLTMQGIKPPKLIDPDRVQVRYSEDGGQLKDGLIELRRGVEDLDLGESKYAQVRIGVKGNRYLKGMAIYSDDMPPGVDIVFNSNKSKKVPKLDTLKEMKSNPDNPFGSTIIRQKGALNIVNEEGTWHTWSDKMSSQFLSKQPLSLVKERLSATYDSIQKEYDSINRLTNPVVKKFMMQEFANGLDAKARDLKAKGMARTKSHVILPFPDMSPNEIYAPNYKNGEKVVLIRHPHGGRFEIPELTVNNKNKQAKKTLKDAIDAVGIHPAVAEKLSGADFDGDTVLVIPNNQRKIKTSRSFKKFDPNMYARDHKTIRKDYMQIEMGKVSNLITDMTIKGASSSELERAVRHSMVVIDSYKHNLDYKQSAKDNGISALRKKYQERIDPVSGKKRVGASTLISRAKNQKLDDGDSYEYYDKKTGKMVVKKTPPRKRSQMDMVKDARQLSSGTPVENAYADYANKIKALKNESDKVVKTTPGIKRSPQAAKQYQEEVKSLDAKLNRALLNAPRERQAQLLATKTYYKNLHPDMDKDDRKKLKTQALVGARSKTIPGKSHRKEYITITDKEWTAIQNGAISENKLKLILTNSKSDRVKELATPKPRTKMTSAKVTRAKLLLDRGYTIAQVADQMGVSTSTIINNVKG